jgi:hypothetical protein
MGRRAADSIRDGSARGASRVVSARNRLVVAVCRAIATRGDGWTTASLAHEVLFQLLLPDSSSGLTAARSPTLQLLHGGMAPLLYEPPAPPALMNEPGLFRRGFAARFP